jgi:hypothetical protein
VNARSRAVRPRRSERCSKALGADSGRDGAPRNNEAWFFALGLGHVRAERQGQGQSEHGDRRVAKVEGQIRARFVERKGGLPNP